MVVVGLGRKEREKPLAGINLAEKAVQTCVAQIAKHILRVPFGPFSLLSRSSWGSFSAAGASQRRLT